MTFSIHNPIVRVTAAIVFVVAALLVLIVVLAWGKELDTRHEPSAFNETFDFDSGNFAAYRAWSERRLRAAHPEANDEAIAALAPFRLEPAPGCASSTARFRNGVVLTHDVLDSAYMLRALGTYFQERCFLVFALLLPGHGTQPGDLLTASWQQWQAVEAFAAREIAREVDNLYLAGHGAGATLAILEAASNDTVDGLMLFAPQLAPRARSWRSVAGSVFGWLVAAARWETVVPPHSLYQYESRPNRLQAEVNALVAATLTALPQRPFEVPVFGAVNLDDLGANVPAMLAYMTERTHPLTQTLIYSRNPVDLLPGQTLISTYYPVEGLLSLSHQGLTLPFEDPEFGWYGASHDCGHYYRRNPTYYEACMAGDRVALGELSPDNLAQGVIERTDFNLFLYETLLELDRFIAPVAPIPPPILPR